MPQCNFCNKPLVPIGNARKNGKFHNDWQNREFHKCCYKTICELPDILRKKWITN